MITMGKKFKKSMAIAMATAMALSVPALPVYQTEKVEAATTQKVATATSKFSQVVLRETGECLAVQRATGDKSKVVYYAVTTVDSKTKEVKWPKESAYEAAEFDSEGDVEIDLSWINRKKEQVLCIATGASVAEIKPQTITLHAQDVLTATYSGTLSDTDLAKGNYGKDNASIIGNQDEGYLTFTKGDKKNPVTVSASAVEYRTANNEWKTVKGRVNNLDLAYYSRKGATLQMRVAPNGVYDSKRPESEKEAVPAGKIINVKIKAKAKAPKAVVNYNDKTVTVPAKVEYSLDGKTWTKAAADSKKVVVDFGTYGWDGKSDKTVYYRIQGDAKKAASKIQYVTIKPEDATFPELTTTASGASIVPDLPKVGSNTIDVRHKTVYDNNSSLVFTNATDYTYQAAFVKKEDIEKITSADKKTLVAASSSAIVAKAKKVVSWVTIKPQTLDRTTQKPTKVSTGTLSLKKGEDITKYVVLYRICDTKGTTVNSETRIMDVPGVVKQSIVLIEDGKKATSEVKIVSGVATEGTKSVTLTVSAGGITSSRAKYTVGAYTDVACTTKYNDLSVSYKDGKLTVANKAKTAKNTYYVKVSVEGTSTVLKVVVE